jgi:hypothetical protein
MMSFSLLVNDYFPSIQRIVGRRYIPFGTIILSMQIRMVKFHDGFIHAGTADSQRVFFEQREAKAF